MIAKVTYTLKEKQLLDNIKKYFRSFVNESIEKYKNPNFVKMYKEFTKKDKSLLEGTKLVEKYIIDNYGRKRITKMPPYGGRVYFMSYDVKDKTLPFYDRFPVIVSLGLQKKNKNLLGINISYLPEKAKLHILELIWDLQFNNVIKPEISKGSKKNQNNFDWSDAVKYLEHLGFGFAIRSYIPERIKMYNEIEWMDWWIPMTYYSIRVVGPDKDYKTIFSQFNDNLKRTKKPKNKK